MQRNPADRHLAAAVRREAEAAGIPPDHPGFQGVLSRRIVRLTNAHRLESKKWGGSLFVAADPKAAATMLGLLPVRGTAA